MNFFPGPFIGVLLFQIGDFPAPYISIGILCCLNATLLGITIPSIKNEDIAEEKIELTFATALKVKC